LSFNFEEKSTIRIRRTW